MSLKASGSTVSFKILPKENMSAKASRKSPSGNKNDIKTTVIIVLSALVCIQLFLLFNKDKQLSAVKTKAESNDVVSKLNKVVRRVDHAERMPAIETVRTVTPIKNAAPGSAGKIAFILDDWGYATRNCQYLRDIKSPLAVAILPNLRHSNDIVKCASDYNKVIMLHLPLEPYHNIDKYPDNYLITTAMKDEQVVKILEDILTKMPQIQGVNNHMGSKATEDKPLMRLIFKHLRRHGLFFIDSMTSPHHSVCGEVAKELKLQFNQRDVFLDNINTREEIVKQINDLAKKARKKGAAIAIGHDRELTMQVLKEQIPLLIEQGFEIVRVKDLLKNK